MITREKYVKPNRKRTNQQQTKTIYVGRVSNAQASTFSVVGNLMQHWEGLMLLFLWILIDR